MASKYSTAAISVTIILMLLLLSNANNANAAAFSFSFPSSEQNSTFPFTFIQQEEGKGGGASSSFSSNSSLIKLVPPSLVIYRNPIKFKFLGTNPGFSTFFSFSLDPHTNNSFSFFLTLSSIRLDLLDGPPPSLISVTFTTFTSKNSHFLLDIHVGGLLPNHDTPVIDFNMNNKTTNILHSWIDYDVSLRRLQVWLSTSNPTKPHKPILSYPVDGLSDVFSRHTMLVGFSSYSPFSGHTKNSTQFTPTAVPNCTLYQWSFLARHGAPYLMHSQPLDPDNFLTRPTDNTSPHVIRRMPHPWGLVLALIFAAACGAMVTFFAFFVWFSICAHRPVAPVEYPVHPTDSVVYEKIVLVGLKNVQNSK